MLSVSSLQWIKEEKRIEECKQVVCTFVYLSSLNPSKLIQFIYS